jgi:surface protein
MFSGRKGLFGAFFLAVSLAVPVLPVSASDTVQITRGEIATELWELAGSPLGPFPDSGFSDVTPATVNKTAIDWLAATGITIGRVDETYGVDAFLTRGEIATMLYRLAGSPEGPFAPAPFGDVHPNGTHTTSINWLAGTGITVGQGHGRFGPFVPVTRNQVRLFVERFAAAPDVTVTVPDVAIRTAPPAAPLAAFRLAANGVTVICPDAEVDDTGVVNGVEYTKVDRDRLLVLLNAVNDGDYSAFEKVCTSDIKNMNFLFGNNNDFDGDISHWDTSSVTDMAEMFNSTSVFDGDISHWDTSSVTTMSFMFGNAVRFNQNIGNWDTSSVTNMANMFRSASAFNADISRWDTSSVTNMANMFRSASAFNANISSWDTSQVTGMTFSTGMGSMFSDASSFNQDLSGWCVTNITSKPGDFDSNADAWTLLDSRPDWGKCPPRP